MNQDHCDLNDKKSGTEKKTEIIDGMTVKYHANGKTVWSRGLIVGGQPEGYWQWYRPDGTLNRSGHFKQGEPVGEWTTYDGQVQAYKTTVKKEMP